MQYKSGAPRNLGEIGQQLGVAHVVEGSVQRAANKVRVNAQLVDARTDAHLWAQTYDRDLADVFAIQSEIAKAIADQLQAKLSPNEKKAIEQPPTTDLAAFDLYVRAKLLVMIPLIGAENCLEAARLLDQAIARDPDFFLALLALKAEAHSRLRVIRSSITLRRNTSWPMRTVKTAIRLRPEAGEAHLARAEFLYQLQWLDFDNARAELALAERTLPNNAQVFRLMGDVDRRQGRWHESARNMEKPLGSST